MSIHKHIILFLRDFYEKKSIFRKTSAASYAVLYHASARIANALSHDVTKCVKEMSMTKLLSVLKLRSITDIIIDMGGWEEKKGQVHAVCRHRGKSELVVCGNEEREVGR